LKTGIRKIQLTSVPLRGARESVKLSDAKLSAKMQVCQRVIQVDARIPARGHFND